MRLLAILAQAGFDLLRFVLLLFRMQARTAAENIALRSQSEVCAKCRHPRRRLSDARRVTLVMLDRVFGVRHHLPLLAPATVRRWGGGGARSRSGSGRCDAGVHRCQLRR